MNNKDWSEKILQKLDPSFKHRWIVYEEILKSSLNSQSIWLDCGCGNNGLVNDFACLAKNSFGIDVVDPLYKTHFVKADVKKLPFPSQTADLVTLRFVVEHFENSDEYIDELSRVCKNGGKIIVLTTNILSPLIFLPRLLLPNWLKNKILTKIFKVNDDDVFPTYHKLNSPSKFNQLNKTCALKEMIFISDLNYTRKSVFIFFLFWHLITKLKILNRFRTNLLVVLQKK
jgi:ubiquinone/menaquinone biosynthesis C-methylase UbiE